MSLGFAETRFLSIAAVIADAMAKAADVGILGLEPSGAEEVVIRIGRRTPDAVRAALDTAVQSAARMGSTARSVLLAKPDPAVPALNSDPLAWNGLHGGREELKPGDFLPNLRDFMKETPSALGILETQGLAASLEAADTMLKSANVSLVGKEKIGAAYVTIIVRGDVAAVKAAVDAGARAGEPLGKIVAAHTIARPHPDLLALLPGR